MSAKTCHLCHRPYTGRQCSHCYNQRGQGQQNTRDTLALAAAIQRAQDRQFNDAVAWVKAQHPKFGEGTTREDGRQEPVFDKITFDNEPGVVYIVLAFRREGAHLVATICRQGGQPEEFYADDWTPAMQAEAAPATVTA